MVIGNGVDEASKIGRRGAIWWSSTWIGNFRSMRVEAGFFIDECHERKPGQVPPQAAVFDLGNVLIDWNPRHLYSKLLSDPAEVEIFLETICTSAWHRQHNLGRPMRETCAELSVRFPHARDLINAWRDRFDEMLPGPVPGTSDLLERLDACGLPLFALTNWPAETFPPARARFAFLSSFRDIVISGEIGIDKPDPRSFEVLIRRNRLDPEATLYIDDHLPNVAAAQKLGFITHHFVSAEALAAELIRLGLLDY